MNSGKEFPHSLYLELKSNKSYIWYMTGFDEYSMTFILSGPIIERLYHILSILGGSSHSIGGSSHSILLACYHMLSLMDFRAHIELCSWSNNCMMEIIGSISIHWKEFQGCCDRDYNMT